MRKVSDKIEDAPKVNTNVEIEQSTAYDHQSILTMHHHTSPSSPRGLACRQKSRIDTTLLNNIVIADWSLVSTYLVGFWI